MHVRTVHHKFYNFPILAEILVRAKCLFVGNLGRQTDHVDKIILDNTNIYERTTLGRGQRRLR